MADIRIKDLATTATTTASDDFMAVDGVTNGTRKLSAAAPSFLTSVTTPTLTAPAANNLTLAGGSSGASLVLGQGATGAAAIAATSGGLRGLLIGSTSSSANFPLRLLLDADAAVTNDFTNTNVGASAIMRLSLVSSSGTSSWSAYSAAHSVFPGSTLLTAPGAGGLVLLATNATGPIDFYTNSSQVARLTAARNLLIGTTSETGLTGAGGLKINSSTAGSSGAGALVVAGGLSAANGGGTSYFGGKVNLNTHTTSTGGIGFGTDVSLFRLNENTLKVQPTGSSNPVLLYGDATNSGVFNALASFEAVYFDPTAHSLILATNGTTRVTIDSTGAATFAGAVSAPSLTLSTTPLAFASGGTGATTAGSALAKLTPFATTATAGGTTTLTNTSANYQIFTGTLAQTIVLPVTSTLETGWTFSLCNNSTLTLLVKSSGLDTVFASVPAGTTLFAKCIGTTNTNAADWEVGLTEFSTNTGTGSVVLGTNSSLNGVTVTGTLALTGGTTNNASFATLTTTANVSIATGLTSGTLTIGGTAQTSTTIIGQSTKTNTFNLNTGATENLLTKTLNIGTGGVLGSTTAITIGSTAGTSGTILNGNIGFYGQAATAKPTGVAVTAAAIHAALVTLNLIAV